MTIAIVFKLNSWTSSLSDSKIDLLIELLYKVDINMLVSSIFAYTAFAEFIIKCGLLDR